MRRIDNLNELDLTDGLDGLQSSSSLSIDSVPIDTAGGTTGSPVINFAGKSLGVLENVVPSGTAQIVGAVGNGGGDDGFVAALADGGFVVVWTNITAVANVPDGFDTSVTFIGARIFNADGSARTDVFQINTATDEIEGDPTVTALTGGGFVVGWEAVTTDGRDLEAYGRVYDAQGAATSDAFAVASVTTDDQGDVSFAALDDGGFFAVWSDERESGSRDMHVYGNYFDADGTARGEDFSVNRLGNEDFHSLTIRANDGSLITIGDASVSRVVGDVDRDANPDQIAINRFGSQGGDIGDEWAAAAAGDSGVAVVSRSGQQLRIQFQSDNSVIQVTVTDDQLLPGSDDASPALVALADGVGFVVAWQQDDGDGDFNVYAQLFDQYGRKVGANTLVHEGTDGLQSEPWITQLANGEVIIGWTSDIEADGAAPSDLYFRQFDVPADLNADDPYADALDAGAITTISRSGVDDTFLDVRGTLGDVNGDGIDDFLMQDRFRDYGDNQSSVEFYTVFGVAATGPTASGASLSAAAGNTVFTITDFGFGTIDTIGDFNGDGYEDFLVDTGFSGSNYILFGVEGGLSGEITLADLDGSDGFEVVPAGDNNADVTSADFNSDGLADIVVNAGTEFAVVYGRETVASGTLEIADLADGEGIYAVDTDTDNVIRFRSFDFNGDGVDDLYVQASIDDGSGSTQNIGFSYFGGSTGLTIGDSLLDTTTGLGADTNISQYMVAINRPAWDFNNDGVEDYWALEQVVVEGETSNELRIWFGEAGVVYNDDGAFGFDDTADVRVTLEAGQDGFFDQPDVMDFNGDGVDDLVYFESRGFGSDQTQSFNVIFGSATVTGDVDYTELGGYRLNIPLSNNRGTNGFEIGDINGDGFEDVALVLGNVDFLSGPGTLIIYGNEGNLGADGGGDTVRVINGDETNDTINGNAGRDRIEGRGGDDVIDGGDGDDALFGNFGRDTITGGAGNDIIVGDNDLGLEDIEGIIYRAFVAVFDRAPDPAGFDIYLQGILIGDLTVEDMLAEFVASTEFQNTYGSLSNAEFMQQLYLNVLDREGDAAGLQSYTAALDAGTLTRAEVVAEFLDSDEFIDLIGLDAFAFATSVIVSPTQSAVYRLYQAVFDRDPDAAGFELYGNGLELDTVELTAIAAEFVASQEFTNTYGSLDNEAFIELLYQNVFDRAADAAGLQAYLSALDAGTLSRADIVLEFAQSNEFRQQTEDAAEAFVRAFNDVPGDTLDGGTGDDILYGGRGADTFLFNTSDGGNDTIMDFEIGIDQIGDLGGLSFEDIIALGTQDGADTVFQFSTDVSLTLANVDLDDLTRDDFGLSAATQKAVDTGPLIAEVDHGADAGIDAGAAPLADIDLQHWALQELLDYGLM